MTHGSQHLATSAGDMSGPHTNTQQICPISDIDELHKPRRCLPHLGGVRNTLCLLPTLTVSAPAFESPSNWLLVAGVSGSHWQHGGQELPALTELFICTFATCFFRLKMAEFPKQPTGPKARRQQAHHASYELLLDCLWAWAVARVSRWWTCHSRPALPPTRLVHNT